MEWFKTQIINDKAVVFDPLRRQYVALTPEEKVRQKTLYYLVEMKKNLQDWSPSNIQLKKSVFQTLYIQSFC